MADFSYPGVSSFSEVSVGAYMENRPASGLNLTPKRRAVAALNSPASANGKITPCRDITPFRRDSQDTIPIYSRGSANVQEVLPPPTLFPASNEHLCEEKWFNAEIQHRKLVSGLWTGAATFLILLGAFVAFHFSFWSPIRSVTSLLQAFFSPKLHALAFIAACVYGIVGFFLACLMARVDQQKRAALSRLETWISFCINLSFFIVVFSIGLEMFFDKSLLTNANVFNFLFCVGTALCAAVNVLSHDYQLLFGGLKLKSVNKNTPGSLIITNISLSAEQSLRQGVKVIACTAIASIFLVPIFFGFSGWLFLFNLSGHYALVTSFTAQILIGHVLHRIIRQKVLQPMQFPFPPPYTVTHPSAEQRRNMSDMLLSIDPLLKLFALFDLRFIAWFDINRRADAYALSQPAGNPKNWKSICGPTLDILNLIKSKVDQSRNKAAGIDDSIVEDSDEEEYLNRNMLMMPPSARGQLFSARTRNRHQTALKPAKKTVQFSNPAVPDKIARWTLHTEETGLLSRLEAEMAVLAIEALDMFVISSFGDDRYGVVQKDLAPIVRAFIGLHSSIDRYLRLKGFSQSASGNEALMRGVEDVLVSAVTRIGEKFSTFIRSIGLTNAEWRLFESIMSQSSINT